MKRNIYADGAHVLLRARRRCASRPAVADAATGALAITGSLGIVAGTLFAALYLLEKQGKEALERKIEVRRNHAL